MLESDSLSQEANNALLKVLEEPSGINYFFIITSSAENVLPTVRSRLAVLNFPIATELIQEQKNLAQKFFKSEPSARIGMINEIIADRDKGSDWLNVLCVFLRGELLNEVSKEKVYALEQLYKHQQFMSERSSSPKMILEHLSSVLPVL